MRFFFGTRAGRREISIRESFLENSPSHFAVQRAAVRLAVLFVPAEVEPLQSVEDGVERSLSVAIDVRVVDAQHQDAVVVARVQPIEDEGPGAADVQKAGGRGRKADTRGRRHEYFRIQDHPSWA